MPASIVLREPRAGDLGWIVHRHGVIYAAEQGWDARFEGLVAQIVADFARAHDPARERLWIAEADGRFAGCVMVVRNAERENTAQLRILLVEPDARGLGIGRRLIAQCTTFARAAGYRAIVLSTDPVLATARRAYEREGYRLIGEEPHHYFGAGRVAQLWELQLDTVDHPPTPRTGTSQ